MLNARSLSAVTKPCTPRSSFVIVAPTPELRWKLSGSCCSRSTVAEVSANWTSIRVFQVSQFCRAMSSSRTRPSASMPARPTPSAVATPWPSTRSKTYLSSSGSQAFRAAMTSANDSTAPTARRFGARKAAALRKRVPASIQPEQSRAASTSAKNPVERVGGRSQVAGLRVEGGAPRELFRPCGCRAPAPGVGREHEGLPRGAAEEQRLEIVKGPVHVAERGAGLGSVERSLDDAILARGQPPRAGELDAGPVRERELGGTVVLALLLTPERLAAREQPAGDAVDRRKVERPEREVGEVDAQVHQAPAPGEPGIVEPGLVRAVGVVEHEVDCVDLAELAGVDALLQLAHALGVSIRQVDAEEPVRGAGRFEDGAHLGPGAAERLLTEHGQPAPQRRDALLGV